MVNRSRNVLSPGPAGSSEAGSRKADPDTRSHRIFHWIAPVYGLFYGHQLRNYSRVLDDVVQRIDLADVRSVLDVGCGTGAMCSAFADRGFTVTGVDSVRRMLDIAARKQRGRPVGFLQADVRHGIPVPDRSVDLVVASYVAHGLAEADRRRLYAEMRRIARKFVMIYDYGPRRSPVTDFIEWMEGGDYFSFLRTARSELTDSFSNVRVLSVGKRAALFVCDPEDPSRVDLRADC